MTDNEKTSATAMSDDEIIKANDILDKFDFFNQRVGRELWSDKPKDIQDKDIENFSNNVKFLKDFINRLQTDKEVLIAGHETLQKALAEKDTEIERLKASNKNKLDLIHDLRSHINDAHSAAIKKFAERLKKLFDVLECQYFDEDITMNTIRETVDNLVKEMLEG